MSYKTGNNGWRIVMLESWNIHRHTGDDGYSAEYADQSPEGDQNVAHRRRRLRPVSQKMGNGAR